MTDTDAKTERRTELAKQGLILRFWAEETPDKPAIIMGGTGEVITYRRLDEESNQLAHALRRAGLQHGIINTDVLALGIKLCKLLFKVSGAPGGGNFFEGNQVGAGVGAESVVLLRQHHAEESQLTELLDQRWLEVRALVPVGRVRNDFRLPEVTRQLLNFGLFFGKRV